MEIRAVMLLGVTAIVLLGLRHGVQLTLRRAVGGEQFHRQHERQKQHPHQKTPMVHKLKLIEGFRSTCKLLWLECKRLLQFFQVLGLYEHRFEDL